MANLALTHTAAAAGMTQNDVDTEPLGPISRLPSELLSECLNGFSFEELLPLRRVSRLWLAAVSDQDAYSRDIDYWDSEASSDHIVCDTTHLPMSLDLIKARLTCSSRNVRLRICTCCLTDDTTVAILELISQHLHRMELLWISFVTDLSGSVFKALLRPVAVLCDLYLDASHWRYCHLRDSHDREDWSDSDSLVSFADMFEEPVSISDSEDFEAPAHVEPASEILSDRPKPISGVLSNQHLPETDAELRVERPQSAPAIQRAVIVPPAIFAGCAPVLQNLSLSNCALDPLGHYPAFSDVRRLRLSSGTEDCVSTADMLAVSPLVEVLEINMPRSSSQRPTSASLPSVPLQSMRIGASSEQTLAMLETYTSAATPLVTTSSVEQNSVLALLSQLQGHGPFTFKIYSDDKRGLLWMHMLLVSPSSGHVRGFEIHLYDHWLWDWDEPRILQFFEMCSLAHDITTIHVQHRRQGEGQGCLEMLAEMGGDWPSVRTVRIDLLGGDLQRFPHLDCDFPALQQVVLFHPSLPQHAADKRILGICTKFLHFFAYSTTDKPTIVLTRDSATADLVTSNPAAAAANNPLCVGRYRWNWARP